MSRGHQSRAGAHTEPPASTRHQQGAQKTKIPAREIPSGHQGLGEEFMESHRAASPCQTCLDPSGLTGLGSSQQDPVQPRGWRGDELERGKCQESGREWWGKKETTLRSTHRGKI